MWGYHYAPWNNSVIEREIKNNFNLRGRFNIKFIFLRPTTYLDWHVDKGYKIGSYMETTSEMTL